MTNDDHHPYTIIIHTTTLNNSQLTLQNDERNLTAFSNLCPNSNYPASTLHYETKMKLPTILLSMTLAFSNANAFQPMEQTNSKATISTQLDSTTTPTLAQEVTPKLTFAISPNDLIHRAKEILGPDIGIGTKDNGQCLAPDFEFCAPVVGPLPREEYLGALGSFQLEASFDITQNFFGFVVDPLQTNRVYFFSRQVAKHVGNFMGVDPSGDTLVLPPQCHHLDFNEKGEVREFGFYTVDRRQGTTGGLGGAFGYFYGVGKPLPIPECQPFKPSLRFRALNWIGRIGKKLQKKKE